MYVEHEGELALSEEVKHVAVDANQVAVSGIVKALTHYYGETWEVIKGRDHNDAVLHDALAIFCTVAHDHANMSQQAVSKLVDRSPSAVLGGHSKDPSACDRGTGHAPAPSKPFGGESW